LICISFQIKNWRFAIGKRKKTSLRPTGTFFRGSFFSGGLSSSSSSVRLQPSGPRRRFYLVGPTESSGLAGDEKAFLDSVETCGAAVAAELERLSVEYT